MAFLAGKSDKPFSNKEMAGKPDVSEAHLSKVLQRLNKAGLITSYRGPKGGFMLRGGEKVGKGRRVENFIQKTLRGPNNEDWEKCHRWMEGLTPEQKKTMLDWEQETYHGSE